MVRTPDSADFYAGKRVLITGGLGFIGSNLARALVGHGAEVLIVDSLVPEYGGHLRNLHGIEKKVRVNLADVRDHHVLPVLLEGQDVLFNLAGQTSHLDSIQDPETDLEINCAPSSLHPRGLPPAQPRHRRGLRQHPPDLRQARLSAGGREAPAAAGGRERYQQVCRRVVSHALPPGAWPAHLRAAAHQHHRAAHASEGRPPDFPRCVGAPVARGAVDRGVGRGPTARFHLRG
ncbi:MAG: GDP-mannose 4,6-dehydratase [Opitutaceae bacterium]|nr:GDP-mannose 4,6-dehydratase [Opitutaceae bacterium]